MKKTNIFTVIGVIVTVAAAVGGIAYGVYRLLQAKGCLCEDDCYEFDCEGCDADDCSACRLFDEDNDEPFSVDDTEEDSAE